MAHVKVTEDRTIRIPDEIWEQMDMKPGDSFELILEGDEVYIVRVPELSELRGIARGADPAGYREEGTRQ